LSHFDRWLYHIDGGRRADHESDLSAVVELDVMNQDGLDGTVMNVEAKDGSGIDERAIR